MLLVGQRDRKLSKVKLAASPVHGTACCEKCGNEIFDQCGNSNRDVWIWDMGTRQQFGGGGVEGSSTKAGSVRLHT